MKSPMKHSMKHLGCVMVVCVVVILLTINISMAQSLWSDSTYSFGMFADRKARAVGDTVTIIINENSAATRSGKADNSKSSKVDMKAGTGIFHGIASASADFSDNFDAKGSLSNTNRVNAKIATTVTEVKPNGNLVITGTQTIKQNGEDQKITITGLVRPDDVTAENTILSTYIADAQILIDGKGPISRKQRQGILSQLLNILF